MSSTPHDSVHLSERQGEKDAAAFRAGTLLLRSSDLGRFAQESRWIALMVRRALLRLRVAPSLVLRVRPLVAPQRRYAFDRFVQRLAYWTGARRRLSKDDFRALTHGPVILMYHAIGRRGEHGSTYVVPRWRFRLQMACLKWSPFRVIRLTELADNLRMNRISAPRSVVLTFDDGFADNCTEALPILRRHRMPATVFVVSEGIGRQAWWADDSALMNRPLMSTAHLRELQTSGVDLGAHSRTHPSLTELPAQHIQSEIAGSRDQLAAMTAAPIDTFAYPFGDCSDAVAEDVARAGFAAACCSRSGIADPVSPLFALPRVEVRGTDSLLQFVLLVWRGHRRESRRTGTTLQAVTT